MYNMYFYLPIIIFDNVLLEISHFSSVNFRRKEPPPLSATRGFNQFSKQQPKEKKQQYEINSNSEQIYNFCFYSREWTMYAYCMDTALGFAAFLIFDLSTFATLDSKVYRFRMNFLRIKCMLVSCIVSLFF